MTGDRCGFTWIVEGRDEPVMCKLKADHRARLGHIWHDSNGHYAHFKPNDSSNFGAPSGSPATRT